MKKYISSDEMEQKSVDERKMYKRVTKKYALADFLEDEFGDLIVASDSMDDIKKSAKQHRIDTDGECILICLRWSDELDGYIPVRNF